ncbi:hypothetical protein AB205_0174100, partial [Aquarana catesbeiana]
IVCFRCLFILILQIPFQNKENHGLVERLTSLASTHAHDNDKLHKLESDLEKSVTRLKSQEEKGKKYRDDTEQKISKLQAQNADLQEHKQRLETQLEEKTQEMKDKMDELTNQLFADVEKEGKHRVKLEKHFETQRKDYEKQIKQLKEEIEILKGKNKKLVKEVEEQTAHNGELQLQVAQLSNQAKVRK